MFSYCGNNPIIRVDATGCGWVVIVVAAATGAVIGVVTAWVGAAVTGQEFTWLDAGVAAVAGAISSFGTPGLIIGGIINGVYSAYTAYENGADAAGIIGAGAVSAVLSVVSFGDLAQAGDDLVATAISGFIDLVFGTGFSSMDAAISIMLIESNQADPIKVDNLSAIDVAMQTMKMSEIRIVDGQKVTVGRKNCSYPGDYFNDSDKVYCYTQF